MWSWGRGGISYPSTSTNSIILVHISKGSQYCAPNMLLSSSAKLAIISTLFQYIYTPMKLMNIKESAAVQWWRLNLCMAWISGQLLHWQLPLLNWHNLVMSFSAISSLPKEICPAMHLCNCKSSLHLFLFDTKKPLFDSPAKASSS